MLTLLAIAARKRFVVDAYEDAAVGVMTKNEQGRLFVSRCTLRPRIRITFGGERTPSEEELAKLPQAYTPAVSLRGPAAILVSLFVCSSATPRPTEASPA